MIKKLLTYALCGVLLLIFIILYKAYTHQPTFKEVSNTHNIILDDSKSIQNLSKSITFKTVSHPNYEKFDYEEFEKLDKQKTQTIGEIDELDNRKEWIDRVGKFGKDISDKFENITGEVLKGVLDSITVSPTFGKNRNGDEIQVGHKLKVKFKLPIINDKLEYIDSSNKSKGYNLVNGKKVKDIGTIGINVGGRGKKNNKE